VSTAARPSRLSGAGSWSCARWALQSGPGARVANERAARHLRALRSPRGVVVRLRAGPAAGALCVLLGRSVSSARGRVRRSRVARRLHLQAVRASVCAQLDRTECICNAPSMAAKKAAKKTAKKKRAAREPETLSEQVLFRVRPSERRKIERYAKQHQLRGIGEALRSILEGAAWGG
jgi:hypothetical protein